ncbi:hypothetical protein [Nocardioides sp.]|jgi:hypothetical protein|nr:hypothetical protein [Nocardioides sp.]
MTYFLLLLAASTVLALRILRLIETDDRGPSTPPASHPVDERFLPPARL